MARTWLAKVEKSIALVSNSAMDTYTDAQERLTQLEIKLCFTEDLVDDLNQIVAKQQQQLDHLMRQLEQLRHDWAGAGTASNHALRDDLPPHY